MNGMKKNRYSLVFGVAITIEGLAWTPVSSAKSSDSDKENDRVRNSGTVLKEVLDVPDDIPRDLLDKARCVIVFPSVLKAAFVVGGDYGRGAMVCRTGHDFSGAWGAPTMMALEGGSFGFQIGGEATDVVILVMNNRGADAILHSKVKLGADASVAAGPKGPRSNSRNRRNIASGNVELFAIAGRIRRHLAGRLDDSPRRRRQQTALRQRRFGG